MGSWANKDKVAAARLLALWRKLCVAMIQARKHPYLASECILLNFGALQCFNTWMYGLKLLLVLNEEPSEVYRMEKR